jgi:hypothetical protein
MELNWLIIFIAALIPMVLGFIWYHPSVFGNAWMNAAGLTKDSMTGANMGLIFGLTYIFSFFISLSLNFIVIHQYHLYSILASEEGMLDPNSEAGETLTALLARYGNNFRTFKHGAFHGTLSGILLAMPLLAINALFERKRGKYILINAGYWVVAFALMGGVICAYA